MEQGVFLEIEDSAQQEGVFVNGRTGQHAHMASYGTCIDFDSFEAWWDKVKNNYNWEEFLEIEKEYNYLSPIIKLFGSLINRKIRKKDDE